VKEPWSRGKEKAVMAQPTTSKQAIREWMALYHQDYEYSTNLAEACADALDLYEDGTYYTIPEEVYEIAMEFYEED
jgi:hypothetical protein